MILGGRVSSLLAAKYKDMTAVVSSLAVLLSLKSLDGVLFQCNSIALSKNATA